MLKIVEMNGEVQGQERFKVQLDDGKTEWIHIWDYPSLYKYPNLYEEIYCNHLDYGVPKALWQLLSNALPPAVESLRILDVACGSGLMGRLLRSSSIDIELLVGIDVLPEAIAALRRDNPNIYDQARVVKETSAEDLRAAGFNCLIICGGASHLELDHYQYYTNFLLPGGYLVFHQTADLSNRRRAQVLQWMNANHILCNKRLYEHRKLMNGSVVHHEVFVYRKNGGS